MVELWLATLPVWNAAELVISLNDDPGGNVSLMARFSSGAAGFLRSRASFLATLALLIGRVRRHGQDGAGPRVDRDRGGRLSHRGERCVRGRLSLGADRQVDARALLRFAGEQAFQVVDGEAGRRAVEELVLGLLDAGLHEGRRGGEDRVVAGDRRVLPAGRIDPLVVPALDRLGLGDHHIGAAGIAGRDDLAAHVLELLREDPRVVRLAGQ